MFFYYIDHYISSFSTSTGTRGRITNHCAEKNIVSIENKIKNKSINHSIICIILITHNHRSFTYSLQYY